MSISAAQQKVIDLLCELEEVKSQDVLYALGAYEAAKSAEQPDDLTHRDKAFETWVNASEGYGLAFARECWNAAWKIAKSTKRV